MNDLFWRNLLLRELCIKLSDEEISSVENDVSRLRLMYPGDKSLENMSYEELYMYVKKNDVSSWYGSYILLRLSVEDVLSRVNASFQRSILKSILNDAALNGNTLGCKYVAQQFGV